MAYYPNNPNGQATSANSAPVVIASDQMTTKGVQSTAPMPTQDMKDSGRTYMTFYVDAIAGVTTEALVTMNINTAGTVSTGTSYTVPTGKTLRLTTMSTTIRTTNTTSVYGRVRVRSAAAVAATSGILLNTDVSALTGAYAAGAGNNISYSVTDGIEIAAGQQIGISQILSQTASTVSTIVSGFLY